MQKVSRRNMLKATGVVGLILPNLPLWPGSAAAQAIDPAARANFVGLSQALTGIPAVSLDPPLASDNASMVDSYFEVLNTVNTLEFQQLLLKYEADSGSGLSDGEIARTYLGIDAGSFTTDATGTFSRLTVLLWLFGVYYGGTEISLNPTAAGSTIPPEYADDYVVSGRAYNNGWAWRIGQTHPMGLSRFGYASWREVPPSLEDYGLGAPAAIAPGFTPRQGRSEVEVPARSRPIR